MQVLSKPDVAGLLDRSMADLVPGGRGLAAWQALLRSHATLMRQLERDLAKETGVALADFDVLAQLARRWCAADDRTCGPSAHLPVGHDPPCCPACRCAPCPSSQRRWRRTWCCGGSDRRRRGAPDRGRTGACTRDL